MERLPIGYWLKRLDTLITTSFDEVFGRWGLGRRHWQVLNSLTRGPAAHAELERRLAHFWEEGAVTLDEVVALLLDRGWIAHEGEDYRLTDAGRATRAELEQAADDTRALLLSNMSEAEYNAVVDGLARMVANLESRLAPAS